jgi:hypothetical protein
MIKLKDILLESTAPNIFIPRRTEDRLERLIKLYIRNGSKGNLILRQMKLTKLPEILRDVNVGGDFVCSRNKLTSLINSPKSVGHSFYCYGNNLTTLEGASEFVGYDFDCSSNIELTSLSGAPKFVGKNFYSLRNSFTEEQVRAVCDVKGEVYV